MSKLTILSLSALLGVMWQTPACALAGYAAGVADAQGTLLPTDRTGETSDKNEPECE